MQKRARGMEERKRVNALRQELAEKRAATAIQARGETHAHMVALCPLKWVCVSSCYDSCGFSALAWLNSRARHCAHVSLVRNAGEGLRFYEVQLCVTVTPTVEHTCATDTKGETFHHVSSFLKINELQSEASKRGGQRSTSGTCSMSGSTSSI
jgi:hypothetical protein